MIWDLTKTDISRVGADYSQYAADDKNVPGMIQKSTGNVCPRAKNRKVYKSMRKIHGFTLAEVLITLGIIGVIAALTIPTLVKNMQHAELKSQFAKANLLVNTVVNKLVFDKSITELTKEYPYEGTPMTGEYASLNNTSEKLFVDIAPYMNTVDTKMPSNAYKYEDASTPVYNITGGGGVAGVRAAAAAYFQDGSILYIPGPSGAYPQIAFDINGYKGPNRNGYDIFWWRLQGTKAVPMSWDWGDGDDCQLTNGPYSGVMCAQYAIVDKCPWDDTKGYWECLP